MDSLRISLIQSDIRWEDKTYNLKHCEQLLESIAGQSDLVVLPEMFSTGFSMNAFHLAETNGSITLQTVRSWSSRFRMAICGSFLATDEQGNFYNRGFFITPEGESTFYDKRHLFRMGKEDEHFSAGQKAPLVSYMGWNIRMIICYDLRFPVWSRNVNNAYDLLICSANWPEVRRKVWNALLPARALENSCYVCGVNRVGKDFHDMNHRGESVIIDFKGKTIAQCVDNKESITTIQLSKSDLDAFRAKFPVWMDADSFEIFL